MRVGIELADYQPPGAWLYPLLRALTEVNASYLHARPGTPGLYASGVRYRREPVGCECWKDIPTILVERFADCEDLACYRAAWLQVRDGIQAWPYPVLQPPAGTLGIQLVHIVVRYPDGSTEDPSRILGM